MSFRGRGGSRGGGSRGGRGRGGGGGGDPDPNRSQTDKFGRDLDKPDHVIGMC